MKLKTGSRVSYEGVPATVVRTTASNISIIDNKGVEEHHPVSLLKTKGGQLKKGDTTKYGIVKAFQTLVSLTIRLDSGSVLEDVDAAKIEVLKTSLEKKTVEKKPIIESKVYEEMALQKEERRINKLMKCAFTEEELERPNDEDFVSDSDDSDSEDEDKMRIRRIDHLLSRTIHDHNESDYDDDEFDDLPELPDAEEDDDE